MPIFHKKVSNIPSTGDPSLVLPSDWNDTHVISGVLDLTSATSVFGVVATFNGVPTGTCNASQLAVNTTNGNLYTCNNGSWAIASALTGPVVFNNQVNTFTAAGTIDLTATTNPNGFIVPIGGGNLLPTTLGAIAYNTTLGAYVAGAAGSTTAAIPIGNGTAGQCAQWTGLGTLGNVACSGSGTINGGLQFSIPYYSSTGTANTLSAANGPTTPNGVPQYFTETPSGGIAVSPAFLLAGVTPRAVTTTSDTIVATDRTNYVTYSNAGAVAVTLPLAGSAGFGSNFVFGTKNLGAGAVTITPTTSQIDGGATKVLNQGDDCTIYSDNTNYFTRCGATQLIAGSNISFSRTATGLTITGSGGGAVSSVFGRTGAVVAVSGDYTLDQIGNPVNNATFQFPATEQLAITGTQPASAGTGVNAATLFSVTTPSGGNGSSTTGGSGGSVVFNMGNGGTATAGTGGAGGDFIFNAASGGTSTAGNLNARMGGQIVNCGANGTGGINFGTAQAEEGCFQVRGGIAANGVFPYSVNLGVFARNTASTSNNTVNNTSLSLGMSSHMMLSGTASVTNGSPNVAQSTGAFFGMTLPGRTITIHGVNYTVQSITNNFNLVLTTNYTTDAGTTTQPFIIDAAVSGGMVLSPSTPGQSGQVPQNIANPDVSWVFEIPSLNGWSGIYHFVFEEGGAVIETVAGGGSIGGSAAFYSVGGFTQIGGPFTAGASLGTFTKYVSTISSDGLGDVNHTYFPSQFAVGGTTYGNPVAGFTDDGKNNGTWVHTWYYKNASGGTLADGTLVKISPTTDQVTTMATTDGPGAFLGIVTANGEANFTYSNGTSGAIARAGTLNGVVTTDNASTIGDVLIPSNATAGRVLSVTMPAPLPGSVVGISQKTVAAAATVDIALQPSVGGPPYMSMLTSTYTNATTTASNITGLSVPVLANFTYAIQCELFYQGSAGTAGLDITVTGPASPTTVFYSYTEAPTATSTQTGVANAFASKIVGNTTVTATTNLPARVVIGLRNGANAGTVQVQGSATGTGTVTVQPGSFCTAWAH